MTTAVMAQGPVDVSVGLRDLPPEGSPLRKLGARLAELLDEDKWAECERMLFDVADDLDNAKAAASDWKKRYEGMAILHANKVRMIENGELIYAINLPPTYVTDLPPNLNSTTPDVA